MHITFMNRLNFNLFRQTKSDRCFVVDILLKLQVIHFCLYCCVHSEHK